MSETSILYQPLGEMLREITTNALTAEELSQQQAAAADEQERLAREARMAEEAREFAENNANIATDIAVRLLTKAAAQMQSSTKIEWGIRDSEVFVKSPPLYRNVPVVYGPSVSTNYIDPSETVDLTVNGELARHRLKALRAAVAERLQAMDATLVIQAFDAVDETPMKTRVTDPEGYDFGDKLGDIYGIHVEWLQPGEA
jgi:hypothetical protein